MRPAFCESHQRFEMITYGSSLNEVIVFNEDVESGHHFRDEMRDFIHKGKREQCSICTLTPEKAETVTGSN